MKTEIKIALAGNPNSGKTTLFNALTGANQYVGNWPGVTVEKKEGKLKNHDNVIIIDLPGIYSLSPYSLEEVIARDYLINERPDAILNIVDATNLERNLYLTTQLTEIGIPVVIALNMMDVVRRDGNKINTAELSKALGCKIIEISALQNDGILEAAEEALDAAKNTKTVPRHYFSGPVEHALAHIEEAAVHDLPAEQQRWYAIKIFERDQKVLEYLNIEPPLLNHIEQDIQTAEMDLDDDAESIITNERYNFICSILPGCYKKKKIGSMSTSDKIDHIVTNRWLALPIFAVVMFLVYFISIGTVGSQVTEWMNQVLFGQWIVPGVTQTLERWDVASWLIDLITDGIIGGAGSVLGFLPQMLILFTLLSLLEDVGYMARVAFIMDRLFRNFGLSGKSFIPMLISSGCAVPGIMASRTIEQERDRRMTIMTTAFIPCGAKMPFVGLIAGALFGGNPWVAVSAYFIGVTAVVVSGIILKKTKPFSGNPAPFVMELPSYHVPVVRNILRATWDRGWSYVKRAGTLIVAVSIMIWVLHSFSFEGGLHYIKGDEKSILHIIGEAIAFLFIPLGFGRWEAAVATLLGLMAKEEVVGVLGSLSSMYARANPQVVADLSRVIGSEVSYLDLIGLVFFGGSGLAAYSFMIFNLLCAPCVATIGAISQEMNSSKWTFAAIGYMTGFAYAISLIVYQLGLFLSEGHFTVWTAIALVVLIGLLYLLFRKNKYTNHNPNLESSANSICQSVRSGNEE